MLNEVIFQEVDRMADRSGHARAFEAYAAVCARQEAAATEAANAKQAAEAARRNQRQLAARTAAGEAVTAEELEAADTALRSAQLAEAHFTDVVSETALLMSSRHDELAVASGEIWRPAFNLGVSRRIEAAREADTALAALAAAAAKYASGTGLIEVAMNRGCKPPKGCHGVSPSPVNTEEAEKRLWNVPHYPHGIALAAAG